MISLRRNRVRIFFIFLLFYFVTDSTFAQSFEIDSLRIKLRETNNDTIKCNILARLASLTREKGWEEYHNQLKPLASKNYERATSQELKNFYLKKIHTCIELEARSQRLRGDFDKAIELQREGSKIAQQLNLNERVANAYNNIGALFYYKGDVFKALEWYEKSLMEYKKLKDTAGITKLLNNLGALNSDFGDLDQAINYYRQSLSIAYRLKDEYTQGVSYSNLGGALERKQKIDSAYFYFTKSLQKLSNTSHFEELATTYCSLAKIYFDKKDFKNALDAYQKGLELYIKEGSIEGQATAYCYLASALDELKQSDKALQYAQKGLLLGKEMDSPDIINRAAYQLAVIYAGKGEHKKAYEMQSLHLNMKDSLKSDETKNFLMKAHYKYEYGKKQEADSIKAIRDKEIYDLKFEKQENEKWFLYAIIALVFIFGAFIFNRFRVTNKQKKVIETVNKDLERQHLLNQKIFSVISHDFRGPMLSLSLMLDKFRQKTSDEGLRTYVSEVSTEVNNANGILSNLLNWARTEINIKSFEENSAVLTEIVDEIDVEFKGRMGDKKLKLIKLIPENSTMDLPPDILRIALRNLISNAIKFSNQSGAIEVIYSNKTLEVKDFGLGISPEKQKQLFKKEVDTSLGTNNEEGFGMGLYIVSELLYKYNHIILVNSKVNVGTIFIVKPKTV